MCQEQFFNNIAAKWDETRSQDEKKITLLVDMSEIKEGETVLDVGCGTGVLTPFLKKAVGDSGRITAIDFAANMIKRAIAKNGHFSGVSYLTGDINKYESETPFDKIVCLNFFPHISDKPTFLQHMKKNLIPGGSLIIMHDLSRQAVNAKHASADTVKNDVLPDVLAVAKMLGQEGYSVDAALENDNLYFIKAIS
ncbi:MAG: methyltransferase domain-containing protein [Sporomusaceae bacterium]|nr:methyltransferase domain-containing protein [Sporomusaceae bacterium]